MRAQTVATSTRPSRPRHPSRTRPAADSRRSAFPVEHFAGGEHAGQSADMKSASSSSNDIPPAVEIARAIGAMPLSLTGTALIIRRDLPAESDGQRRADAPPPPATGRCRPETVRRLAQPVRERLLASRRDSRAVRSPHRDRAAARYAMLPALSDDRLAQFGATAHRSRRLRCRLRVITASPRTAWPPNDSATPFSGWPSKRSRKISDQATVNPQLAGRSGDIATPFAASVSAHAAIRPEPRPARAAERQHGGVGITARVPSGVSNDQTPASSQPLQR